MLRSKRVRHCLLPMLVGGATVGLLVGSAAASLVIDVRVDSVDTSLGTSPNGKTVNTILGGSGNIVMGIYAIPGNTSGGDDSVQAAVGSIDQAVIGTGVSISSVTDALVSPMFNGNGSQLGTPHTSPAWIGGTPKDNNDGNAEYSDFFGAMSSALQTVTSPLGIKVGTATWHVASVTPGGTASQLNFVPDIFFDAEGAVWMEDSVPGDSSVTGTYLAGSPIVVNAPSPEPSTLILLLSGVIGLLAYAWRWRPRLSR
jgi:hypothetical protein